MRAAIRLSAAAVAATLALVSSASAQTINFTTTGFFTGGGATPCTVSTVGATSTCSYANGSALAFAGAPVQQVVGSGTANFGAFTTTGSALQSYAGNSFTLQIMQTTPTPGSFNVLGTISGTISATAAGGTGGLVWTPSTTNFNIDGVNYRIFVDNVGGVNIEPPKAGGVTSDLQTIRGSVAATTVPEPSTYVLMSAGLAGLFFASKRRRRAA
jgi:hypothetical protein